MLETFTNAPAEIPDDAEIADVADPRVDRPSDLENLSETIAINEARVQALDARISALDSEIGVQEAIIANSEAMLQQTSNLQIADKDETDQLIEQSYVGFFDAKDQVLSQPKNTEDVVGTLQTARASFASPLQNPVVGNDPRAKSRLQTKTQFKAASINYKTKMRKAASNVWNGPAMIVGSVVRRAYSLLPMLKQERSKDQAERDAAAGNLQPTRAGDRASLECIFTSSGE